ncbi:hypothetical protein JCM19231_4150 [Vibrio ishigakensis]|uniref:Uncharacterized protein n=1 Tax=Vibrio ishigakensis TaxID=1481914 RepID=A0A0B8P6V6_9VIBR|nr:hypothetical protein JCM19231_4150 [Vibrio ishigakensis]
MQYRIGDIEIGDEVSQYLIAPVGQMMSGFSKYQINPSWDVISVIGE